MMDNFPLINTVMCKTMNKKVSTFSWVYSICLYLLFGGIAALKSTGQIQHYNYILLFAMVAIVCLPIAGFISIVLFKFRKSEFTKEHKEKLDNAIGMRLGTIGFLVVFTGFLMVTVFKAKFGTLTIILGFILAFFGTAIHFVEMAKYKKRMKTGT